MQTVLEIVQYMINQLDNTKNLIFRDRIIKNSIYFLNEIVTKCH